jgi:hypothetical protein
LSRAWGTPELKSWFTVYAATAVWISLFANSCELVLVQWSVFRACRFNHTAWIATKPTSVARTNSVAIRARAGAAPAQAVRSSSEHRTRVAFAPASRPVDQPPVHTTMSVVTATGQ